MDYFVLLVVLLFFFLMIRRPPRSTRTTHSFPTRRSSDLQVAAIHSLPATFPAVADSLPRFDELLEGCRKGDCTMPPASDIPLRTLRSEEHTSELQSLMRISYAVFCLKKKKKK